MKKVKVNILLILVFVFSYSCKTNRFTSSCNLTLEELGNFSILNHEKLNGIGLQVLPGDIQVFDTITFSSGISLRRYTLYDIVFPVVHSDNTNKCVILDVDDLYFKKTRIHDKDDLSIVQAFIRDEKINFEVQEMGELIKHMYSLNNFQLINNKIKDSLISMRPRIIGTTSTKEDSVRIWEIIDLIIENIEQLDFEEETIYGYFPDYTMFLQVVIPHKNPSQMYLKKYYLTRQANFSTY